MNLIKHLVLGTHYGNPTHIIVGPAEKIGAIFGNKEARAAGLFERVKKSRADVNDSSVASGRDVAKLTVSNVSAQAVQANIASPRSQSVSDDSDQQQSDFAAQKLGSPARPVAKLYTYSTSTMPSSNAYHGGRARGLMAVFNSTVLPNSTHAHHEGLDPDNFFEVSEFFDDDVDLQQHADHDDNKDPTPASPLPSISFARRAARCGKAALPFFLVLLPSYLI